MCYTNCKVACAARRDSGVDGMIVILLLLLLYSGGTIMRRMILI